MDDSDHVVVPRGRWLYQSDGSPVPGWYEYGDFWRRAIETAPPGSTLVEVGVFCGRSIIDIVRMAREANKGLQIVGVDNFRGSVEHTSLMHHMPRGALTREAWVVLDEHGVLDDVILIVAPSVKAARLFRPGGVWACFLDADHSVEAVKADIAAWQSKIVPGGFLGGDDYHTFDGVREAVDAFIPGAITAIDRCWWETRL